MKKEDVIQKMNELVNGTDTRNPLSEEILRLTKKALDSGALDVESYDNTFKLPKIILSAALFQLYREYFPDDRAGMKETRNLRYFI